MAPHYLRFARAVALVPVIASAGCYDTHVRPADAPDAAVADAGPRDAGNPCLSCECDYTDNVPNSCERQGLYLCCAVTGPLAPPDLAV